MPRLTTHEPLNDAVNLGFPIFLLIIAVASFIWFAIEVKLKRLDFKSMATWLTMNIIYTIVILYTLIMAIVHLFGVDSPNIFNTLANDVFGLNMTNGKEWVILLIFGFISYILMKSLRNSIEIAKLNKRVDELSKQVAILAGKVNKTADYGQTKIASFDKTAKEVKNELREKVKIAKAERKAKEQLKMLSQTIEIKPPKKKIKKIIKKPKE